MHLLIFFFSLVLKQVTHSNYILNTSRLSLFEFVIVWFGLVWFDLIQFHFGLCVDFRVRLVLRESKSMVFLCYFIFIRLYYFIFFLIRIGTSLTFDFILQECCGATIRAYFLPFKPFLEILSLEPKCKQNQNSTVTPWSRLLVKAQTSENLRMVCAIVYVVCELYLTAGMWDQREYMHSTTVCFIYASHVSEWICIHDYDSQFEMCQI